MTIYLDHNATSPPSKEHLSNLFGNLIECAGNPSSPHAAGRGASVAMTQARRIIAQALGVESSELIFVSGATEANNLATMGVLRYQGLAQAQAVFSSIEHAAILEPLHALKKRENLAICSLNPNTQGFVSIESLIESLTQQTTYLTLMAANNELGTIQPVKLLGDFLHYKRWGIKPAENFEQILQLESHLNPLVTKEVLQKIHFHVDAVQAFGKIPSSMWLSAGIDSCAISGHKVGSLSGIGALFLRRGRHFNPLFLGGAQEKNRRAGSENLAGIISFSLVCHEILQADYWEKVEGLKKLQAYLYFALAELPGITLNSPLLGTIPNTINFSVELPHKNGEDLLLELDLHGIQASSGSACSSGANLPSHVLIALGKSLAQAKSAVRFSMGIHTTREQVQEVIQCLNVILKKT